uniref:Uncharacterized protein n=1 Tax=Rhodnius prolixus TaxID=13249 RepID=T1HX22_RHOPR
MDLLEQLDIVTYPNLHQYQFLVALAIACVVAVEEAERVKKQVFGLGLGYTGLGYTGLGYAGVAGVLPYNGYTGLYGHYFLVALAIACVVAVEEAERVKKQVYGLGLGYTGLGYTGLGYAGVLPYNGYTGLYGHYVY